MNSLYLPPTHIITLIAVKRHDACTFCCHADGQSVVNFIINDICRFRKLPPVNCLFLERQLFVCVTVDSVVCGIAHNKCC